MQRFSTSALFLLGLLLAVSYACVIHPGSAQAASIGGIVAPVAGSVVNGIAPIEGVAQHPGFRKWQLDLLINGDAAHASFIAVGEKTQAAAGLLASLDTTRYPNGQHQLRLRVVYTGLNYDEFFTPIVIANLDKPAIAPTPATAAPTAPTVKPAAPPKDDSLNDPALVADQGGGRHKLPYAIVALPPLGQGVPDGRRWIEVDISDQMLTAWQGERVVLKTQVSTGKPGYETITGSFKVYHKYEKTRMTGVDYDTPDVPWTMYFKGGFAVHGAYWHNNFGKPVSHGCVNMKLHEAKVLFEWASVGTEVVVHE